MKTKKTVLLLLGIILIFGVIKAKKIKRYFAEVRYYNILVKLDVIKKSYSPYGDFATVFEQEGLDYKKMDQAITLSSLNKLLDKNLQVEINSKIPTITHHVYFTSEFTPIKLPDFYIEKMKVNFNKLNSLGVNWQHYIWTNDPDLFPNELKQMKGVIVKNITEFKDHDLHGYLLSIINKGAERRAYFMEASDMVRLMALQKFGGIYNDIDYEIYNPTSLFKLMTNFDFIGGREFTRLYMTYYGNAFMAAKANHPIINEAIRRLELYNLDPKNPTVPEYIKYPRGFFEKLYFNSPPLLTIAYFKKNNLAGNNDIILPSWMVYNVNFAHSKNGECESIVDKAKFNYNNLILPMLLSNFITNIKLDTEPKAGIRNDIYYNLKDSSKFEIIGADMFCGTWSRNLSNKIFYYWNWPFSKFMESDEN